MQYLHACIKVQQYRFHVALPEKKAQVRAGSTSCARENGS